MIRTAGFEPVKAGGIEQSGRLEVGGDLHDLVVGPAEARSLIRRWHERASVRAVGRVTRRWVMTQAQPADTLAGCMSQQIEQGSNDPKSKHRRSGDGEE